MSMLIPLTINLEKEFFQLEELESAQAIAERNGGVIYSWKTTGRANWLEKCISVVDVLGLIVLPDGLSSVIDMVDDPIDESE